MGINVTKLLGSNPILAAKNNGQVARAGLNPVKDSDLYASMNALNKTYGQSPVVEDYANTEKYFGDPVLKHLAYC